MRSSLSLVLEVVNVQKHREINDSGDGHSVQRLREIAVATLLEGTLADRLQRALRSKTRPAGELLDLKVGDLVVFFLPSAIHKRYFRMARTCKSCECH